MLFLPESVERARELILKKVDSGKDLTAESDLRRLLDLDPEDAHALCSMAEWRKQAGQRDEAEKIFWRAIETQPGWAIPYIALAHLFARTAKQWANALIELGLEKLLIEAEPEAVREFVQLFDAEAGAEEDEEGGDEYEKGEAMLEALSRLRAVEPPEITERLKWLRLLNRIQSDIELEPEVVEEVLGAREQMSPLLIGLLRGFARGLINDEDVVEVSLGLLGEMGDAAALGHVTEFVGCDSPALRECADWAASRIAELNPEGAEQAIREIAAHSGAIERVFLKDLVANNAGRFRAPGQLIKKLLENLDAIDRPSLDHLIPILLFALMAIEHRQGIAAARTVLRQNKSLLSSAARKECEEVIQKFERSGAPPLPSPEPLNITVYDICGLKVDWGVEDEDGEDEDLDPDEDDNVLEAPAPVVCKSRPGRNEPCWCGSGLKYKKCHMDADDAAVHDRRASTQGSSRQDKLQREFDPLRSRLQSFATETIAGAELSEATREFFGARTEPSPELLGTFMEWVIFDRVSKRSERTVAQQFLKRHGTELSDRERAAVEGWSRSYVALYEITDVHAGKGLDATELATGRDLFIHDLNLSTDVVRWDGILTRVAPAERGDELISTALKVERALIKPLLGWIERDKRSKRVPWPEYFKSNLPRIVAEFESMGRRRVAGLKITNQDSEELVIAKATYEVADGGKVLTSLKANPALVEDVKDQSFSWLKGSTGDEGRTVLGKVLIKGRTLTLECNSRERLKRGKSLFSSIGGRSLRHVRDQFESAEELKRKVREQRGPVISSGPGIPPEVERELVGKYLEQHYADWPDRSLPALGGQTPRNAIKTEAGKRAVVELLRDFENGEERNRREGRAAYDINRLRSALGLIDEK